MTLEYIEIEAIAKQRNLNPRTLLRHCYNKKIKLYTYVIAKYYKVEVADDKYPVKESTVLIDRKYLAIDHGSIDDLTGREKSDSRIVCFNYQTSADFPKSFLNPINTNENHLSKLQLYLNANDVKKLDEPIRTEKYELAIDHVETTEVELANKPIKIHDERHNDEMQKIAEDLATKYALDRNGKTPSKKAIADIMFKKFPKLGSYETILRRIKMTWKPRKSRNQRPAA